MRAVRIPPAPAARVQLRWAREDAGLTQRELIARVGVSRQAIAKLESPERGVYAGRPISSAMVEVPGGLAQCAMMLTDDHSQIIVNVHAPGDDGVRAYSTSRSAVSTAPSQTRTSRTDCQGRS